MSKWESIAAVVGPDHRIVIETPYWPVGAEVEVVLQAPSESSSPAETRAWLAAIDAIGTGTSSPPTALGETGPEPSAARAAAIREVLARVRARPVDATSREARERELQEDRDSWER
ncbi:MAG: hypothetical protein IT204_08600 [Fimbriimonadaceae bacterium]|nr:hypothetical protein [Fimbriimonadaceae bacterium]